VAYAYQNRRSISRSDRSRPSTSAAASSSPFASHRDRRSFRAVKEPQVLRPSEALGIPSRLANQILTALPRLTLTEVAGADRAFLPARPPSQITAHDVLRALRVEAGRDLSTRADDTRERLRAEFDRMDEALRAASSQVTLQDLAESSPARPGPPAQGTTA
jgi:DNA-binding IscR family transcriptional regulator